MSSLYTIKEPHTDVEMKTDVKVGIGIKILIDIIVIGAIGAGVVAALIVTKQI